MVICEVHEGGSGLGLKREEREEQRMTSQWYASPGVVAGYAGCKEGRS